MTIDPTLLRRAWPAGHLPVRGVRSRRRWTCEIHEGADRMCLWVLNGYGSEIVLRQGVVSEALGCDKSWAEGQLADGALLPYVNPTDATTWLLLLQDLAAALRWPPLHGSVIPVWDWRHEPNDGTWVLLGSEDLSRTFNIDTDDPALALVLARIQVREEEGR